MTIAVGNSDTSICVLSGRARIALFVLTSLLLAEFVVSTLHVRGANSDDRFFNAAGLSSNPEALDDYLTTEATHGSRFYYALPPYHLANFGYRVATPWAYSLIRGVLFYSQWVILGWLIARITRSEAAGWLLAIVAVAAVHFTPSFNAVVSHPEYSIGSTCLFLALLGYLGYAESGKPAGLAIACVGFTWALLNHENFIVFVPLFWAMDVFASGRPQPAGRILARSWPLLAMAAVYVAVYFWFRSVYPSTYDGTQFAFSPAEAIGAWCKYTFTIFPGFELLMARESANVEDGRLLRSPHEILSIVAHAPVCGIALALGAAIACGLLLARVLREAKPLPATGLALFLYGAGAANVLISSVGKYQLLAHHRFFPYFYSISAYAWGLAFAVCALGLLRKPGDEPPRRGALVGGIVFFAFFLSATATNAETVRKLILWFN